MMVEFHLAFSVSECEFQRGHQTENSVKGRQMTLPDTSVLSPHQTYRCCCRKVCHCMLELGVFVCMSVCVLLFHVWARSDWAAIRLSAAILTNRATTVLPLERILIHQHTHTHTKHQACKQGQPQMHRWRLTDEMWAPNVTHKGTHRESHSKHILYANTQTQCVV